MDFFAQTSYRPQKVSQMLGNPVDWVHTHIEAPLNAILADYFSALVGVVIIVFLIRAAYK